MQGLVKKAGDVQNRGIDLSITALRTVQLPGLVSSKEGLRPLTDAGSLLLGMQPVLQAGGLENVIIKIEKDAIAHPEFADKNLQRACTTSLDLLTHTHIHHA